MQTAVIEYISTALFFIAITHTFFAGKLRVIAEKFPHHSIKHEIWHLLSDVEVVFGIWSFVFLLIYGLYLGVTPAINYLDSLNFTEPAFVFVIMCMAATRPVIYFARAIIVGFSKLIRLISPLNDRLSFYISVLIIGPVLGSFITEPAAMTVSALILLDTIYKEKISLKFKYATIALLFVNISIGGTLTHFAAPPVLMVASKWQWDTLFMMKHFGYKAIIAILISTSLYSYYFRKELNGKIAKKENNERPHSWLIVIHLLFLVAVILSAHHPKVFIAAFFLFLGLMMITHSLQDKLKIKESLLVGFFLAGLICLGTMQAWWIRPLLTSLGDHALFIGATTLTSITDNAALTYLGSLIDIGESSKYALVAGAVAGGGLTVIANAPNPAGFAILGESFGTEGIKPMRLILWALIPTIIGMSCFLFLPSF